MNCCLPLISNEPVFAELGLFILMSKLAYIAEGV